MSKSIYIPSTDHWLFQQEHPNLPNELPPGHEKLNNNAGQMNFCYGKFGKDHPAGDQKLSEQTRKRQSIAKTGAGNPNYGKTFRPEENGMYGKKHSLKSRIKMSEAVKARHARNKQLNA